MEKLPKLIHQRHGTSPISVYQQGQQRWLTFDDDITQSLIDLSCPGLLPSPVNQAMLASLMTRNTPQNVLLAGTGGGSIARFFHHHQPTIAGHAVEISAAVANIAQTLFEFPAPSSNWQLIINDIQSHLLQSAPLYDLIIVDISANHSTPQWVYQPEFLTACQQAMSDKGVLVINFLGSDERQFATALIALRRAFPNRTACLTIPSHRNTLMYATSNDCCWGDIPADQISQKTDRWGLGLTQLHQQLQQQNPTHSGLF